MATSCKFSNRDVLFVGWGNDEGVTHYRTKLPARVVDADWAVFSPEKGCVLNAARSSKHKVLVVQNSFSDYQLRLVGDMKRSGAVLVANVDDWIKSVGRLRSGHGMSDYFAKSSVIGNHLRFLELCDYAIVSTEWLAKKVEPFFDPGRVLLVKNGLDHGRYDVGEVERDSGVIIGWSGGTGHRNALRAIVEPIERVLDTIPTSSFACVGDDVRSLFSGRYRSRLHHLAWGPMELYPRKMRVFDINLAPAMDNDFYRAKSQLRLYESCAMGIPMVAHPMYDELVDGVHGLHASTPAEWYDAMCRLLRDDTLRASMGNSMRELSTSQTIESRADEWDAAIAEARMSSLPDPS